MAFKKLDFKKFSQQEMLERSKSFLSEISSRRTVREFSNKIFPIEIIENCIKSAGTAPSGANKQPWSFTIIEDKKVKAKIRIAAEKEEKEFYGRRATKEWLEDLNQFGTNWEKPFLETAPYLIIVFKQIYDVNETGSQRKNYYVNESVGIASGFLLAALHNAGLATLTHTPSPMNFLGQILNRPENEKAYLLIPVGYPSEKAKVPNIKKKSFSEISKKI
tara:strand:+ start:2087 stop:2743 length:657 start_codon:yes stop_codon:yes gene_type:complete